MGLIADILIGTQISRSAEFVDRRGDLTTTRISEAFIEIFSHALEH